jgi:hypothetical protein
MRSFQVLAPSALCFALLLAGCSLSPTATPVPEAARGIQGNLHGGRQPIAGAAVYLYAAGTGGYGGPSTSLLNSNVAINNRTLHGQDSNSNYYVLSDALGNFNISNDYTCTAGQQIYIYAVGGDPGSGINPAAGVLALLGTCPGGTFSSSLYIVVDEVSTIAAAYSFAGFATDATHVSSSGTVLAQTGIANAFATAANLADLSSGVALQAGRHGSVIAPQQTVNTLANILAACINSEGPGSSACTTLFETRSAGETGGVPADTANAAIYLAHNPGFNTDALYTLPVPQAPFGPALTSEPNDFTLALIFDDVSINNPFSVAIDAAGNAWIANYSGSFGNAVTELSGSTGDTLSGNGFTGGGLSGPYSIAIDQTGNAWIANSGPESGGLSVTELNGVSGAAISGPSGYTGGGLLNPEGVAVDASGYIWIANAGNSSVTQLYGSNAPVGHSPGDPVSAPGGYKGGGQNGSTGLAIDQAGFIWIADSSGAEMAELNGSTPPTGNPGDPVSGPDGYFEGGVIQVDAVAIDASGYVWAANDGDNTVSQLYGSNAVSPHLPGDGVSPSNGYSANDSMNGPSSIAVDGAGNVWVANQGGSVTEMYGSNAVSPNNPGDAISGDNGYNAGQVFATPQGIAIDGSGNVWIADAGAYEVIELVGAASPVVTPMVANTISPYTHPASRP